MVAPWQYGPVFVGAKTGVTKFDKTTEIESAQAPFTTFHFNITDVPEATPRMLVEGLFTAVIVAPLVAPTIVHSPNPTGEGGSFNVKFGVAQSD